MSLKPPRLALEMTHVEYSGGVLRSYTDGRMQLSWRLGRGCRPAPSTLVLLSIML